jgi:hypothetical protein
MTRREVIDRACSTFINDVAYSAALKKMGIVRVPVLSSQVTPQLDDSPANDTIPVVTFTLEYLPSGARRPCASYQGYSKLVD